MKIKLKFQLIFIVLILILLPNNIFAKNCGGNIECNCGDTLTSSYKLNKSLNCNFNGLNLKPRSNLNCNNYEIIGKKRGNGISIIKSYLNTIQNCEINNFSIGIQEKYSNTITIKNNIFKNNYVGIDNLELKRINIIENKFINNSNIGVKFDEISSSSSVLKNTFYKTGINTANTYGKTFCSGNNGNSYFDGAIGFSCSCVIPKSNIIYDSNINFCNGKYYLPNGIIIGGITKKTINCNNMTIYGNKFNTGILFKGGAQTTLKNCNIKNYSKGIYFTYKRTIFNYARINQLYNNNIFNTKYAIFMDNDARAETIYNNQFANNYYNIYNNINSYVKINANNNWWGTNNETIIKSKFLKPNLITYTPYKNSSIKLDLEIKNNDIILNETSILLNIYKTNSLPLQNVDLEIFIINKNGKIETIINRTINLNNEHFNKINILYNLLDKSKVIVVIDPKNKIIELNENNNKAKHIYENKRKYYLNFNKNSVENLEFEKYFINSLRKNNIVSNSNSSDIEIKIIKLNNLYEFKLPYEGKIESKLNPINNKLEIEISGVDIEGQIFGVKEFIKNKDLYINSEKVKIINNSNLDALKVYDYLHTLKNILFYKTQTKNFARIVEEILNDKTQNFKEIKMPIIVNNRTINYRIWNLDSKYSDKFKSYIDPNRYPIVMGGGLWSDITTWRKLGDELSNEGHNVYLIELTGSNNSECDTCYNYKYEFLTNILYPKYINTILNLSNKSKVKYVGHSNGARTALDSLSSNSIEQNKIDTLIVVGVPGAFEELSFFAKVIKNSGQTAIDNLNKNNISHITIGRISHELESFLGEGLGFLNYLFGDDYKISTNLFKKYYYWINNKTDNQPGENISLNKFGLIYGNYRNKNNDRIVSVIDEREIYNNVNANNKYIIETYLPHNGMSNKLAVKYSVKKILKNEKFN